MKTKYCMKCMLPINGETVCPHCGYEQDYGTLPHRLQPGTILIDRYLIGCAIGQGGFGITYVGRDLKLDLKVAVKEYYPSGYANRNCQVSPEITIVDKAQKDFIETGKKKFLREARALAHFDDEPGVVKVKDYFEANQTAYIVMEYLDGIDLRAALKKSLFQADEIFALMRPVMEALEKIHKEDIIHRDISPDNIMRLKNGTVKLMDFGAARILDYTDEKSKSVVLKEGYAPEEQYRPKGIQGPWSDVYALCATIYKCITGETPDDALQRCYKDELKWPSQLGYPITAVQESVLQKGMAVKQENRFQNVRELMDMLDGKNVGDRIQSMELNTDDEDEDDCTVYWDREKDNEQETPEADVSEKEEPDKPEPSVTGKKKISPVVGVCVAGAAAVVILGIVFFGKNKEVVSGDRQAEVTTLATESAVPSEEHASVLMRDITLTASEKMSVKEFNKAIDILRERLKILVGSEDFSMTVDVDKVKLSIPEEAFGGLKVTKVLQSYVSRSTDLYLFDVENVWGDRIAIGREDLESVTEMFGALDGVDAAQYGITTDEYRYLAVVLTDSCAEKYKTEIETWGDRLTLGQDMDLSTFWYHNTVPAEDGKTLYLINADTTGNFNDLLYYNLTHDPIPYGFYYTIDMSNDAEWEMADEAYPNLRSPEELIGDIAVIQYTAYFQDFSDGDWLDTRNGLKERLDMLEMPYAFGVIHDAEETSIIVKTGYEHMGSTIMRVLGGKTNLSLQTGLGRIYFDESYDTLSVEQNADGSWKAVIDIGEYTRPRVEQMLAERDQETLYLMAGIYPYMQTANVQLTDDGKLEFDRLCFAQNEPILEDDVWAVRLLEKTVSGVKMPVSVNPSVWWVDFEDESMESEYFPVEYSEFQAEVNEAVHAVRDSAAAALDGSSIKINLYLDVDETLPETAVNMVKTLYEASGFEDSPYTSIWFYLVQENNDTTERARIHFSKYYGGTDSEGHISGGSLIAGGRMERYKEEMKRLMEADPFYQGKDDGNYSFEIN